METSNILNETSLDPRRRKSDSSSPLESPKAKRCSIASSLETPVFSDVVERTICLLQCNDQGVRCFDQGDFEDALALFGSGVAISRRSESNMKGNAADDPFWLSSSPSPRTSSYIFQRSEFDEGMIVYNFPQRFTSEDAVNVVEATLFYNAGQALRELARDEEATVHFTDALSAILPALMSSNRSSVSKVHAIAVPVLHNLGLIAYQRGRFDESIAAYKIALDHCLEHDGSTSLSLGLTLNCLGVVYYHGTPTRTDMAISCCAHALRILIDHLGRSSTRVATVLNNIGRSFVQKDDIEAALGSYLQALHIRREQLGNDSIDYAATAFNIGQSYHESGRHDEALFFYKQFLVVAKRRLMHEHRDVAMALSGMAQIYQQHNQFEKATGLFLESIRISRLALGDDHCDVAMLLSRLGNFYFERHMFDSALKIYKEGLKIERTILPPEHPNIVVTLSNIGEIFRRKKNYDLAIEMYDEAMNLQRRTHGEWSAEVASAMTVIGLINDQKGNTLKGLDLLQEALAMRRDCLGGDHPDVASSLTYIGTIMYRKRVLTESLQVFLEALRIRVMKLGMVHRDVSFTLYNIGLCYQLQGHSGLAILCFQETLRIEREVLGATHKDVALTLHKLAKAERAEGKLEEALGHLQEAVAIERCCDADFDAGNAARILCDIGNIYLIQGKVSEVMCAFVESARLFREAGMSTDAVKVSSQVKLYACDYFNCAAAA